MDGKICPKMDFDPQFTIKHRRVMVDLSIVTLCEHERT